VQSSQRYLLVQISALSDLKFSDAVSAPGPSSTSEWITCGTHDYWVSCCEAPVNFWIFRSWIPSLIGHQTAIRCDVLNRFGRQSLVRALLGQRPLKHSFSLCGVASIETRQLTVHGGAKIREKQWYNVRRFVRSRPRKSRKSPVRPRSLFLESHKVNLKRKLKSDLSVWFAHFSW